MFVRRLTTTRDENFDNLLSEVYKKVHDIPYDLNFKNWWIAGMYHIGLSNMVKRHVNFFGVQHWCVIFIESYN